MRAGTHGFDVSGGSVWLASNTVYHIVLRHVGMAGDGTLFKWETSATSSPDPGAAQGWSIPGPRVNIGSWRQYTTTGVSRLKFQIIGYDSSSTSLTDGGIRYQGDATTGPTLTGNLRVGHTVTVDTSSITDSGGVAAITSGLEPILYSVEADKDLPSNVAALAEGVRTTRVSGTTATATLVGGQGNKMVTACYEYGDAPISTVCSRLYGPILPVDVPAEGDVTVSGTPQVDIRLSADVSTITDDLDGLTNPRWTYQWERADNNRGKNAADISEATSFEYTPVKADQGKYLRATVGFTDDLANMETKSSGWLGAVARRANVPSQGDVEITSEAGTVQVDAELTADLSGVTDPVNGLADPDWQYDWQRADDETGSGEVTISSARGETYTPTEVDDQGKYLRVQVSGFDDDVHSEVKTSPWTLVAPRVKTDATGNAAIRLPSGVTEILTASR